MITGATIHICISLAISVFSYPESVSQEVDRERRLTPDAERKLQGTTTNLHVAIMFILVNIHLSFFTSSSLVHPTNHPKTSLQLSVPRTRLNPGKRVFSVAAPLIWNELPITLDSSENLSSFRKDISPKCHFHRESSAVTVIR